MPSIAAEPVVHVAAGVIAEHGRYFITRRARDAHQGGKWEFPGGKVDRGESVLAALRRELHEELGIEVTAAQPFMRVRHAYPEKTVLLDVWSVTAYTGRPHGREGQEGRWVAQADMLALDFPAADLPVQRRLWLPSLYAISDCARLGRAEFFARLEVALTAGLRLLQLREPQMSEGEFVVLAREVSERCHPHGAKVLLNADPALVEPCGADGVHLSAHRLLRLERRPAAATQLVGASCHDESELARAAAIGADLVVIGPVAPTATHPQAVPLGWERFEKLCRAAVPAVYALGGMHADDLRRARQHGAQGVAMIGGLWAARDCAAVVAACESAT
jgi:8-oxo-dGTP diphosphatase